MVNLPIPMVEMLDHAAYAMGTNRTAIIIRSLSRDLQHVTSHEIDRVLELRRSLDACYLTHTDQRLVPRSAATLAEGKPSDSIGPYDGADLTDLVREVSR